MESETGLEEKPQKKNLFLSVIAFYILLFHHYRKFYRLNCSGSFSRLYKYSEPSILEFSLPLFIPKCFIKVKTVMCAYT